MKKKTTSEILAVVHEAGPSIGFTEADISARFLRLGFAMVLLTEKVNPYTILLVRRWKSDTMIHYLHTITIIFTEGLAVKIYQHSNYALVPPTHAGN